MSKEEITPEEKLKQAALDILSCYVSQGFTSDLDIMTKFATSEAAREYWQRDWDEFERWVHNNFEYHERTDLWHSHKRETGNGWAFGSLKELYKEYLKQKQNGK